MSATLTYNKNDITVTNYLNLSFYSNPGVLSRSSSVVLCRFGVSLGFAFENCFPIPLRECHPM